MNGEAPPLMRELRKDLEEKNRRIVELSDGVWQRKQEVEHLHARIETLEKEVARLNGVTRKLEVYGIGKL